MLANLSGEIPQHAKPIQLMRVAHLLKFFFKSKAKQAIKKIGIFATLKLTKSTSQEEIKIETIKFELDNETSSILESRKIDKPKAHNSHLDSILRRAKLRFAHNELADKNQDSRDKLPKPRDSASTRDEAEYKAIEYEIGVISRLRQFQKLEFLSNTVENLLTNKTLQELKKNCSHP